MRKDPSFLGCLVLVLVVPVVAAIISFIGGSCLTYSIEFWTMYVKGAAADVPFILAAFLGLLFCPLWIWAAIITWICSFFL